MPPILRNGRMSSASAIMPRPPIHWIVERQRSSVGGCVSRLVMTVEPVVVIPDTISKYAFMGVRSTGGSRNGKAANAGTSTQADTVRMIASRKLSSKRLPVVVRMHAPPKPAVTPAAIANALNSWSRIASEKIAITASAAAIAMSTQPRLRIAGQRRGSKSPLLPGTAQAARLPLFVSATTMRGSRANHRVTVSTCPPRLRGAKSSMPSI